jgi:Fe-S cluster assembly protein SufD
MALAQAKPDTTAALIAAWDTPTAAAKWANTARSRALSNLRATGAPGRRDEYWRFTNPATLTQMPAQPAAIFKTTESPPFDAVDRLKITFVDGVFDPALSDDFSMEALEIEQLSDVLQKDIHWAREVFGTLEANGQTPVARPLAALNTGVSTQGIALRVTGRVPRPVCLRYLRKNASAEAMIHHVIRLEEGADLTLLENGPGASRLNKVMEIDVADGAKFHHVRTQGRDHERRAAAHIFARLGRESSFKSFSLTVNGRLTRNEIVVEFTGDDAHATIAGACLGDGSDFHHDDTVFVTHGAMNCESRQVFKHVLRNGATGVFQGKILVRQVAQKTDGYQISQALLLDDDSQFLAKPELEIYADDVVCSHGSTCGAVDVDALFYLTSRGIPKHQAQDLLVLSFLSEAIREIEDAGLAADITARLGDWMARRRG